MAIKQTIKYNSNNTYFAGFLQNIIDESEISGGVIQSDESIILTLDDRDKDALERFSQNTTKYLPHSIFLGDIDTINEELEIKPTHFTSKTYNISLCPRCLEKLTNPASDNYLDDSIKCDHYSNSLNFDFIDNTNYSPHYSEGDTLLVVDTSNINELFILTKDETKALLSIEKPTIKVTIKDETLKELTGKKFINIKTPYSIRSTLVSLNAKDGDVPYIFFKSDKEFKVVILQDNLTTIKDTMGIANQLENLEEDSVLNRFLNISKEAGFIKAIGANLSSKNGISFIVSNQVGCERVITLQEFRLGDVLEQMKADDKKQKLLVNFEKKYSKIMEEFVMNPEYDLFETLSCLF